MNLLIEFFDSFDRRRNAEFLLALHENTGNAEIDRIHVFVEAETELNLFSEKFEITRRENRPTFGELFEYCNEKLAGEVCVIANSDIIFNNTLALAKQIELESVFLALSRWEMVYSGRSFEFQLNENAASQDAWIFQAPITEIEGMDFPIGTPGCDNRIAKLMHDAGYQLRNPAKRIVTAHFHLIDHRNYSSADAVPGPYILLPPIDTIDGEQPYLEVSHFDSEGQPIITSEART